MLAFKQQVSSIAWSLWTNAFCQREAFLSMPVTQRRVLLAPLHALLALWSGTTSALMVKANLGTRRLRTSKIVRRCSITSHTSTSRWSEDTHCLAMSSWFDLGGHYVKAHSSERMFVMRYES